MSNLVLINPQPANQTPANLTLNSNSQAGGGSFSGQLIGSFQPGSQSPGSPSLPNNPGNNNGSVGNPLITIGTGGGPSEITITQTPDGIDMSRFTDRGSLDPDIFFEVNEHDQVFIDVLANDTGAVSVLSLSGQREGPFSARSFGGALVTVTNNGVVYDAGTLPFNLQGGVQGFDVFFYTAMLEDGSLQSTPVFVLVTGVNDAPIANDDAYIVSNFAVLNVGPGQSLILNDFDPDGPILQTTLVSGPANGFLTLFPNGTFTYDPDPGFVGTDSFVYRLSDSELSDTAKVTITVTNAAPVAVDDEYDVNHDSNLIVAAAAGVLDNDSDGDGNPLTVALVTGPANGTLTLNPDGSFEYTPDAFFIGTDSFTYSASDGITSDTATVTINVVNEAPVANDDVIAVTLNTPFTFAAPGILGNDTDAENDALAITAISTAMLSGALTISATTGALGYTPVTGFVGIESINYTISDGWDSDTATVTFYVGLPTFYQGAFRASGEVLSGDADDLFFSFDPNPSLAGYFLFYAEVGDTVTLDVDRAEGDFDPYLWVFQGIITDPAATFGTDIGTSDPGFVGAADDEVTPGALPGPFGDPRITFVAPSTGYYTAIVTEGASGANSGGDGRFDFTIGFTIA